MLTCLFHTHDLKILGILDDLIKGYWLHFVSVQLFTDFFHIPLVLEPAKISNWTNLHFKIFFFIAQNMCPHILPKTNPLLSTIRFIKKSHVIFLNGQFMETNFKLVSFT